MVHSAISMELMGTAVELSHFNNIILLKNVINGQKKICNNKNYGMNSCELCIYVISRDSRIMPGNNSLW